jgi:hypothetical protein
MIALVLSRARHVLSHSVLGSSLAGDGLLVRLRSTSIGLLGVVTAVGLGLIAFIAQLGWPGAFNAPIPGSPREAGTVHDAIALTQPAARSESALRPSAPASRSRAAGRAAGRAPSRHASSHDGSRGDAGLDGSHQLGAPGSSTRTPPAAVQPPPAPAPTGQAIAAVPVAPSTPPVTSEPSTSVSGSESKGQTDPKPHGTAGVKPPVVAGGEPGSSPVDKDDEKGGEATAKPDPVPSKPSHSPEKPGEGHAKPPPKASAPPVVAPPSQGAPEGPVYDEGKYSEHSGKSGWHRH